MTHIPGAKYQQLLERVKTLPPIATAVAHPASDAAIAAAVQAAEADIITPILIGPQAKICAAAAQVGVDISRYELICTEHSHAAAERAVVLVREGRVQMLMKGSLHTDELMAAVVRRDTGLRTARRVSHCFVMDVPANDSVLIITDAAINVFPTLEDKVDIVQNAIELAHALGIREPKVAILSAMESVNPKVPSTIEAAALCKMTDRGQIRGGILDGPLALDNAINADAARVKGIGGAVAGHADVLVTPDLEAGNMLAKSLSFLAGADGAGIVLGARVPIVLTSRADSVRSRLASCAVAAMLVKHRSDHPGHGI